MSDKPELVPPKIIIRQGEDYRARDGKALAFDYGLNRRTDVKAYVSITRLDGYVIPVPVLYLRDGVFPFEITAQEQPGKFAVHVVSS